MFVESISVDKEFKTSISKLKIFFCWYILSELIMHSFKIVPISVFVHVHILIITKFNIDHVSDCGILIKLLHNSEISYIVVTLVSEGNLTSVIGKVPCNNLNFFN